MAKPKRADALRTRRYLCFINNLESMGNSAKSMICRYYRSDLIFFSVLSYSLIFLRFGLTMDLSFLCPT